MKLVTAASIIGLLNCANESAAFTASSGGSSTAFLSTFNNARNVRLAMSTHNDDNEGDSNQVTRRDALFRAVSSAMVLGNLGVANAAEFSGKPTSGVVKAMSASDTKVVFDDAPDVAATATATKPYATATAAKPYKSGATIEPIDFSTMDPTAPTIALATAIGAGYVVSVYSDDTGGTSEEPSVKKVTPPPAPYGLQDGRNFFEGADISQLKADAPAEPAPEPEVETVEAVEAVEEPKQEQETPKWYNPATPYGIENKNKNPYIKQVEEYCEGGKVKVDCSNAIRGYLDELNTSGTKAQRSDTKAIVGYLDSLTSTSSAVVSAAITDGGVKTGAALTSYLDALSAESTATPVSAKAVKGYLDTLTGLSGPSVGKQVKQVMEKIAPKKQSPSGGGGTAVLTRPGTATAQESNNEFDVRLTNVEDRVTRLEDKVDKIPDQVFAKFESWQVSLSDKLSGEVKKIVDTLGAQAAAISPPAPAPAPEAASSNNNNGVTTLPSGATVTVSVDTTVERSATVKGMGSYLDSMGSSGQSAEPPSGKGIGGYLDGL